MKKHILKTIAWMLVISQCLMGVALAMSPVGGIAPKKPVAENIEVQPGVLKAPNADTVLSPDVFNERDAVVSSGVLSEKEAALSPGFIKSQEADFQTGASLTEEQMRQQVLQMGAVAFGGVFDLLLAYARAESDYAQQIIHDIERSLDARDAVLAAYAAAGEANADFRVYGAAQAIWDNLSSLEGRGPYAGRAKERIGDSPMPEGWEGEATVYTLRALLLECFPELSGEDASRIIRAMMEAFYKLVEETGDFDFDLWMERVQWPEGIVLNPAAPAAPSGDDGAKPFDRIHGGELPLGEERYTPVNNMTMSVDAVPANGGNGGNGSNGDGNSSSPGAIPVKPQ